jgi:hypothetical protein
MNIATQIQDAPFFGSIEDAPFFCLSAIFFWAESIDL